MDFDVKDLDLAEKGHNRITWADREMPVLAAIRERFGREKPLKGLRLSACLHVTTETANLARTLKDGGAEVVVCASNPLSTQDDVAASLVKHFEIQVFAIKDEDRDTYYKHIEAALDKIPNITMDDGADLITVLHSERKNQADEVLAGTEETTTGVIRLASMADKGILLFPVIAVNNAMTKHLFDNRYGTGQSTMDGILRATNLLISGRKMVVCGYGWCGRGIAMRAKGLGANVTVCEVDPLRALEAVMDGYLVEPIDIAASKGEIFVTATGNIHVLAKQHFELMKDGAVVANAGHFNVEIDIDGLEEISESKREAREFVSEYKLKNGNRIYLLADGRLVNLSSAEGHPAAVMDMSFANQALSAEYAAKNHEKLEKIVYDVPVELDEQIAKLKLETMGIRIDELTGEQQKYLKSWEMGT